MATPNQTNSPFAVDGSPKVSVEIGPFTTDPAGPQPQSGQTGRVGALQTFENVIEYCYASDILSLGDQFSLTLSNVDGDYSGQIGVGDTVKFAISDQSVTGGGKVQKIQGIITQRVLESTKEGGCKIMITGADLGWHLVNNTGPLFQRYRGKSINTILQDVCDPSWNLKGVRQGNDFNRRAKQGRADIQPPGTQGIFASAPPIQWEPGMMISDVLIALARRQKYLLNVSADGFVQFFTPSYSDPAQYVFHHHKSSERSRVHNNVKSVRLSESIDGIYTNVVCVGQIPYPTLGALQNPTAYPNEGKKRGSYTRTNALPFKRTFSFGDGEQFDEVAAKNRAQWKWQRGQFDSWEYEITVKGHSHVHPESGQSFFYEPDTMCELNDSVFGITGRHYVSQCQYRRTMSGGTETIIKIHKPDVLGA